VTNLRPAPVPASRYNAASLRGFAAGEHEDFLAAGGRGLRPRLARALDLAEVSPGMHVVDVGCGRGEAAVHAARRGARVTAVDYSPDALRLTRATAEHVLATGGGLADEGDDHPGAQSRSQSRAMAPKPGRVDCVAADAGSLPLPSASVERVLLLDVAEHLHPWQLSEALGEIHRILIPGGRVVIHTLPNRWALAVSYPLLRLLAPTLPTSPRSDYEREVHVHEQSPLSLARALRRAGLKGSVWVEEWTTTHAALGRERDYPDPQRARGYPVLRRPIVRWLAAAAMRSPARVLVGNDIFAVARRM